MVDTRFFSFSGARRLGDLLDAVGLDRSRIDAKATDLMIDGADELVSAIPSEIALAATAEYLSDLKATSAGVVIVSPALRDAVPAGVVAVESDRAHERFVDILDILYPPDTAHVVSGTVGPQDDTVVEDRVRFGHNVVIGPGVEIGRDTVIGHNVVLGAGVTIGRNASIGSNVSIEYAHLGNGVIVHAGARIGNEGFGWLDLARSNRKIPQLGRVIVQDRVEIGANATIDRGALGDTVIGEATKIDNLVQIGHNCRIGRYCLIAATCGLSGSTVLEDSVLMGGGAATAGHLTIGRGSIVLARAGVSKSLPAGSRVGGFVGQDVRSWRKEVAMLRRMTRGDH